MDKIWNNHNGTLIVAGGSGSSTPHPLYAVSPYDAIRERVARDHGMLRLYFPAECPDPHYANADVNLVFINAFPHSNFTEGMLTDYRVFEREGVDLRFPI